MLLRKKDQLDNRLNTYQIKNYKLISDEQYCYIVNVNNNVFLNNKKLKSIDIKFNEIKGNFDCSYNELNSLKGCPEIICGDFFCFNNKLTSLEFCPKRVEGIFCSSNNSLIIEGLKYLPKEVKYKYIELFKNEKLGCLQKISNFDDLKKNLKEIIKIKEEKEHLLNSINKEILKKNRLINKI